MTPGIYLLAQTQESRSYPLLSPFFFLPQINPTVILSSLFQIYPESSRFLRFPQPPLVQATTINILFLHPAVNFVTGPLPSMPPVYFRHSSWNHVCKSSDRIKPSSTPSRACHLIYSKCKLDYSSNPHNKLMRQVLLLSPLYT